MKVIILVSICLFLVCSITAQTTDKGTEDYWDRHLTDQHYRDQQNRVDSRKLIKHLQRLAREEQTIRKDLNKLSSKESKPTDTRHENSLKENLRKIENAQLRALIAAKETHRNNGGTNNYISSYGRRYLDPLEKKFKNKTSSDVKEDPFTGKLARIVPKSTCVENRKSGIVLCKDDSGSGRTRTYYSEKQESVVGENRSVSNSQIPKENNLIPGASGSSQEEKSGGIIQ